MEQKNLFQEVTLYADLLKKQLSGTLSLSERRQLAAWLRKEKRNREMWMHFKQGHDLKDFYSRYQSIDPLREYELLVKRYPQLGEKKSRRLAIWTWSAAMVVLLIGAGVWWQTSEEVTCIEKQPIGKAVAVLHTSRGEVVRLNGQDAQLPVIRSYGLHVEDSLNELVCRQQPDADTTAFHQLEIPRGGEYKLILADGTKIWLNSETTLRFPVQFGTHVREISLCGEAYFQVAHDPNRPFRIRAGKGQVEVLGTTFVMNVYPDGQQWSATLADGSVKAVFEGQCAVLRPGEQAYLNQGKLLCRQVDIEKETAWVNGLFIFRHDPLEEVTEKLSRWYDVEFRFEHEKLKTYVFTGQVSRDIGIENILSLMEQMNVVSFEQKNGYILIKEKVEGF